MAFSFSQPRGSSRADHLPPPAGASEATYPAAGVAFHGPGSRYWAVGLIVYRYTLSRLPTRTTKTRNTSS